MTDTPENSGTEQTETQGSVVSLADEARKKKKRDKDKLTRSELINLFCDAISRMPWCELRPEFPRVYHVTIDHMGVRSLLEEEPGQVMALRSDTAMADTLMDYSRAIGLSLDVSSSTAREIVTTWKALQKPIDEKIIAPVREKSEPGYCWHRLAFDLAPGATPHFDELMSRTTNAMALKAFIGSLLLEKSDRQQYVWIWGEGRNGKGSLAAFLHRILGPAYRSEAVKAAQSNFWTAGLVGSRLVVFPDCTEYRFPTTGIFKMLTGGDAVRIERKGRDPSTAELCCKFMFLSNNKPEITSSTADMRRAIYCEMKELEAGTTIKSRDTYGSWLDGEAAAFLYACKLAYEQLTDDHGPIGVEAEAIADVIAASEEHYAEMFERIFEVVPSGELDEKRAVQRTALNRVCSMYYGMRGSWEIKRFNDYLSRRGVRPIYVGRDAAKHTQYRLCGVVWSREALQQLAAAIGGGDLTKLGEGGAWQGTRHEGP